MTQPDKIYDVLVIGAGPGGMTAALYASRANLSTIMLERGAPGGQMINTAEIENYSGFDSIMGPDLATNMFEGSQQFGAEYTYGDIKEIIDGPEYKEVKTADKSYFARAIIIATGAEHKKLGISGEQQLNGSGVSYCAVCDGAFFRDKHIAVIGGGDSAVEEGTYLTQFAKKVTIIHRRDQLRAQKILQNRAFKNEKIDFIWDTVVDEIRGEHKVESLLTRNVNTNETEELPFDGVFIYIGLIPNSEVCGDLPITDEDGWIVTDEKMQTAIPGIFAIGDVRATVLRQVATAVGDGAIAGNEVFHYVEALKENS